MLEPGGLFRPISHRGLHGETLGLVENTAPAFEAAIARGYAIECDVRASLDGVAMVFHDATLFRLVDDFRSVSHVNSKELKRLVHRGTSCSIMTLDDFVDLVGGRVPVVAEIKSDWGSIDIEFVKSVSGALRRGRSWLASMSFDPLLMLEIKHRAPGNVHGFVASYIDPQKCGLQRLGTRRVAALGGLDALVELESDFLAYNIRYLPDSRVAWARANLGLPVLAWTVRSQSDRTTAGAHADAIIFEGFEPAVDAVRQAN